MLKNERALSIFPNPASEHIYIGKTDHSDKEIVISTIEGKVVYKERISDNTVNISLLQTSLYFINVKENGKVYRARFIKQ